MARIVIADDTAMMRNQLRLIFERRGDMVIAEADNGKDAVAAYTNLAPDLITMDINMPVMTGLDAVKEIKATFPQANIVMISTESERSMLMQAVQSGVSHYILKPFEEAKVVQVVDHLLGSNAAEERLDVSKALTRTAAKPLAYRQPAPESRPTTKRLVNDYLVGYVVGDDVYNRRGKLLLRAGHPISAAMIELLRKNDITHVNVK